MRRMGVTEGRLGSAERYSGGDIGQDAADGIQEAIG